MKGTMLLRALCLAGVIVTVATTAALAQTYPRTVLIEEFTSATCAPCAQATPIINALVKNNAGRVVSVRYHMNFPLPGDPMYTINKIDNDTRKTYYGVIGIPAARVGGELSPGPTNQTAMSTAVSDQLALASTLKVDVTQAVNAGQLTATIKVTANADGLTGSYVLRTVVVEKHLIDSFAKSLNGSNGEIEFYDVMRVLLPNAAGQAITLNPNQTKTFTVSTPLNVKWVPDQLYVVAFVQDDFAPNAILQSGASQPAAAVRDYDQASSRTAGYTVNRCQPNPATNRAVLDYTLAAAQDVTVQVYDMTGSLVRTVDAGHLAQGTHQTVLDLTGLPAGAYRCTMRAGSYQDGVALTVVR